MSKRIITFFSYKGGACRTSTAFNSAPFFANFFKASVASPILMIDMDFDSMGLTYLFNLHDHFRDKGTEDIKSLVINTTPDNRLRQISQNSITKNFVPIGEKLGLANETVFFLGCNEDLQLSKKDVEGKNSGYLDVVLTAAERCGISTILMDSAAGDQFSAKMSIDVADAVVFCMRPSRQFQIGSFSYLERRRYDFEDKKIYIVPTAVPEEVAGERVRENSLEQIRYTVSHTPKNVQDDMLIDGYFGIPEVTRFKWSEDILYKLKKENKLLESEVAAYQAYERLANRISYALEDI